MIFNSDSASILEAVQKKDVKSSTIDRIKASFAKKLFRMREVNKRRSGEKQKKKQTIVLLFSILCDNRFI